MTEIENRKKQHMDIAQSSASQSGRSPLWDDVVLLPLSLPEVSVSDIDLTTTFVGHRLQAPLLIAGMTGGHEDALRVNGNLAAAAETLGIAIGTGSQRAALLDPRLVPTYAVIRERAPNSMVIANLGMSQLIRQGENPPFGSAEIQRVVEMIDADFLAIHLNAVEELVQPEGDRAMTGIGQAISECVGWSPVPVIAKETGAGMTRESAVRIAAHGVAAIDVGGVGGTSFARIEAVRAQAVGDERGIRIGETFMDWGIPTALSLIEASAAGLPLIGTGGVRNGLHAAKALALGASLVGIGGPAINAALDGVDAVIQVISDILEELRVAMTLIGTINVEALARHRPAVVGQAAEWLRARDLA
jgi:isopentenyl-diphosphate delta-isomerase